MDVDKFYSLLFNLYASQEDVQIGYTVDDIFFTAECFNENHFSTLGTASLSCGTVHPFQNQIGH